MPTDLDPKTVEVWAGLREQTSRESVLQDEIDSLRAALSGYDGYRDFLRSQAGFADYEDNLTAWSSDIAEIASDDVTETVAFLGGLFADFDTFRGDDSSGALAQPTYDDYRSFLLDNGAAAVDADRHIQLLKLAFDPDTALAADVGATTDWDGLEQTLVDNGVASDSAAATVDALRSVFATVSAFDRQILASGSWTEVETYLTDNGLDSTTASDAVADLKTAYGSTLDTAVKDQVATIDSYDDLEQYLLDQGLSQERASTVVGKVQRVYDSFGAFRTAILSSRTPLSDLLSTVEQADDVGDQSAGLKIFETAGETINGVDAPAGAVSIRGTEVHFSQLETADASEATAGDVTYSDLTVDTPSGSLSTSTSGTITVSATLENTNTSADVVGLTVPLLVNGAGSRAKTVDIPAGQTTTVAFTFAADLLGLGEYVLQIGDSGTATVVVTASGIFG